MEDKIRVNGILIHNVEQLKVNNVKEYNKMCEKIKMVGSHKDFKKYLRNTIDFPYLQLPYIGNTIILVIPSAVILYQEGSTVGIYSKNTNDSLDNIDKIVSVEPKLEVVKYLFDGRKSLPKYLNSL